MSRGAYERLCDIPMMVAVVAAELPEAASAAGAEPSAPELSWSLEAVGETPSTDEEAAAWWRRQRSAAPGGPGSPAVS